MQRGSLETDVWLGKRDVEGDKILPAISKYLHIDAQHHVVAINGRIF